MIFDNDGEPMGGDDVQKELESVLPPLRTFVVRRYKPELEMDGEYQVEEVQVRSHGFQPVPEGGIVFTKLTIYHGRLMPQTHRGFQSYLDVEEVEAAAVPTISLPTGAIRH